jgi:hypothetical protein
MRIRDWSKERRPSLSWQHAHPTYAGPKMHGGILQGEEEALRFAEQIRSYFNIEKARRNNEQYNTSQGNQPPAVSAADQSGVDWPWCIECQSYHHPNNPTCYALRGGREEVLRRAREVISPSGHKVDVTSGVPDETVDGLDTLIDQYNENPCPRTALVLRASVDEYFDDGIIGKPTKDYWYGFTSKWFPDGDT